MTMNDQPFAGFFCSVSRQRRTGKFLAEVIAQHPGGSGTVCSVPFVDRVDAESAVAALQSRFDAEVKAGRDFSAAKFADDGRSLVGPDGAPIFSFGLE